MPPAVPLAMLRPSALLAPRLTLLLMDAWDQCCLPDDISYAQWVRFVFDHPVLDPQWWWQDPESGYRQEWNAEADTVRTLSYLTQLFEQPEELVQRFTHRQIDQGLNYLVSNACSDHMFVLRDEKLPWAERRRCIDAMIPLYAKLMAPVYQNELGHLQTEDDLERINFACYMWWDIIPLYGGMDHPDRERITDAVLHVFAHVLKLRAESCIESALHGLGHWHLYVPARTEPIVRRFLKRTDISAELRRYAEDAASGAVQ